MRIHYSITVETRDNITRKEGPVGATDTMTTERKDDYFMVFLSSALQ